MLCQFGRNDDHNRGVAELSEKRYHLTKMDLVVMAVIGLASVAVLLAALYYPRAEGTFVQVTVAGEVVDVLPLSEDAVLEIEGVGGKNTLTISDGAAKMTDADCPDALCVRSRAIGQTGEQIICLPHQVICEIIGDEPQSLDVILS